MDIADKIRFLSDAGDEIGDSNEKIEFVVFDGTNEELFVSFLEIMFRFL